MNYKVTGEKGKEVLTIEIPLSSPVQSHYKGKDGSDKTSIVFAEVGSRFGGGQDFAVSGIPARFSLRVWVPENATGRSAGIVKTLTLAELLEMQKAKV